MSSVLLLLLAATTSVAAVALLARRGARPPRGLGQAFLLVLEWAGISTLFLAGNLLLGVTVVLAIRSVSSQFVSIYVLNDISLVALSALQGAVCFCWRRGV